MGRTKKIARISTNWSHARIPYKQPKIRVRVIPKSPIAKSNARSNSAPADVSPNVFGDPEYEEDDFDFGSPTIPRSSAHVSLIFSEEANFDDVGSTTIPRAPAHVSPNVSEDSEPKEDDIDDVGSLTMPMASAPVSPNVSEDSESDEDDINDVHDIGSPTMPRAPAHVSPNVSEDSEPEEANFDDVGSPTMLTGGSDSRSNSVQQNTHVTEVLNAPSCNFVSCETVKYSQGFILKSLHVEGVGALEIPLSAEDVRNLREACERSLFGHCWEIDASKVTFPGAPHFLSEKVQPLVMNALRDLGQEYTGVQMEARFRNIFLCETDDDDQTKFLHEDIMRKDNLNLFATFLLQIPTEDGYKGGNFVVQHRNAMKALDCHMVSSIGFCYTIFLAECKVEELQKVTSGTRVCLTLDLVVKKQDDDASQQAQRQKPNLVRSFIYLSSDSDEDY